VLALGARWEQQLVRKSVLNHKDEVAQFKMSAIFILSPMCVLLSSAVLSVWLSSSCSPGAAAGGVLATLPLPAVFALCLFVLVPAACFAGIRLGLDQAVPTASEALLCLALLGWIKGRRGGATVTLAGGGAAELCQRRAALDGGVVRKMSSQEGGIDARFGWHSYGGGGGGAAATAPQKTPAQHVRRRGGRWPLWALLWRRNKHDWDEEVW
jgi:hypothetical protein